MWIFIKGIPEDMDSKMLDKFIKRLLFPFWLPIPVKGRIKLAGSKILKIVHIRSKSVEYHGLVQVLPSSKAEGVIKRINRAQIDGRQLQSHLYSRRFGQSDRRRQLYDRRTAGPYDHRRVERRRNHLVSQVVDASL